jgi:hypothetical protein
MITHDIRDGITIVVEDKDISYHSYRDWNLYVANNDPIGEPKQYTNYVEVPGRNGKIDLSEVLAGRPVFLSREIKIYLAGLREIPKWDTVMSDFRNHIDGRVCRIIFDTDPAFYWRGRVDITDFKPAYEFGKFCLSIPEADPYKYSVATSGEPWKWDPFNFINGVITYSGAIVVSGTATLVIPHGYMPTTPDIVVSNKTGTLTMVYDGVQYELNAGVNKIPSVIIGGDDDVTLTFTGNAKVEVVYRSGSL